jgi:hypothetical protein
MVQQRWQLIEKKIDEFTLLTDVSQKKKAATNIYKQFVFDFDVYSGVYTVYPFLLAAYRQSFVLYRGILRHLPRESLRRMNTEFTKFRKRYEKYRRDRWGVDHWARYLPVELLNIIDSFM